MYICIAMYISTMISASINQVLGNPLQFCAAVAIYIQQY